MGPLMEFNLVRTFSVVLCVVSSLLILSSSKILTKRSRYERVTEYLAPTSSSAKDPISQLMSYLKDSLRPIIDKFSGDDFLSSLVPIFKKVVGEIDLKYAVPLLVAFISVAIVTRSATFAIGAGLLAPFVILIFKSSRIYQGERNRIRELNDALPLYIEQIGSFVASGLSIQSAIDR
jgi:pilus assembly protein TadC